ncbi:Inosine-5'-monophosphate dehydrogenase [Streptomyces sp. RB5]|uniref:Inosine-5'-monophosphate dehydrogenase n=1 Tax=Streptomyces smaragdinus TaxID=2585196 RepID=A0A7K0CMP6_9ACTN|nr:CBS domain-containing protein [Streptomyces smaragdinus]MQY14543.1 Inosine-5'-monophosphate dehydrogenase [Streptomyces smaragdinus]
MKHQKTGDVMTTGVVHVTRHTPFKEIADLLVRHRISGLPVVDDDDKVIGVISETDLMMHQAGQGEQEAARAEGRRPRLPLPRRRARARQVKAGARTAGDLMSAPAVTVPADDSIASAARTMAAHGIERLPVVDVEDRLVGIVTRRDLLQIFLRPDSEIRREVVEEVLVRTLWLHPQALYVAVQDGVVTLRGEVERASEISIAVQLTGRIDGVIGVVDRLTSRTDDTHLRPVGVNGRGVTDAWLRRL